MDINLAILINPGFVLATLTACMAAKEAGNFHPNTGEPKLPVQTVAPWVIGGLCLIVFIAFFKLEIAILAGFPVFVALFSLAYANNPKVIAQRRLEAQVEQLKITNQEKAEREQANIKLRAQEEAALKAKLDAIKPVVPSSPSPSSPLSPAAQKIADEIARRRNQ
jgi:hypothetical protein